MKEFIKSKIKILSAKEIREQNNNSSNKNCTNNTGITCGENVDLPFFHIRKSNGDINDNTKGKR